MAYIYGTMLTIPKSQSFSLFGARSTGKSTWLQQAFRADEHLWVDLTNPEIERRAPVERAPRV